MKLIVQLAGLVFFHDIGDACGETVDQNHVHHHVEGRPELRADPAEPSAAEDHDGTQADEVQSNADPNSDFTGVFTRNKEDCGQGAESGGKQNLPQSQGRQGFRLGGIDKGRNDEDTCRDGDEALDKLSNFIHGYSPYNPSFCFKAGTYCLEMMIFSPFFSFASRRPLKAAERLVILDRSTMVDFEIRRKSVPARSSSSS